MRLAMNNANYRLIDPIARGYHVLYREDAPNRCPGCGKDNWLLGRMMAQCAFCETALPLEHVHGAGAKPRFIVRNNLKQFEVGPAL